MLDNNGPLDVTYHRNHIFPLFPAAATSAHIGMMYVYTSKT